MNWTTVSLTIVGAAGAVTVLLGQLRDLLGRATEVVRAWRELRKEMKSR